MYSRASAGTGITPALCTLNASQTSRFFLLTAIAALGLKTKPGKLLKAGPALIAALVLQSLLLLGLVVAGVYALRLIPT